MKKRMFFLFIVISMLTIKGNAEAKDNKLIYPMIGVFGNYSTSNSFMNGEGSNVGGGVKIGLSALMLAGVDLSLNRINFKTDKADGHEYISNLNVSIWLTSFTLLEYIDKKNLYFVPCLSLGVGSYRLDGGPQSIGENIGLKIFYLPQGNAYKGGSLVGLDFGGYYNRFPYQGNSVSYTEIRAGITVLIND